MEANFYSLFPESLRTLLQQANLEVEQLQEVRMRVGRPLLLRYGSGEYGITVQGKLTRNAEGGRLVSRTDLDQTLEVLSGYSMYAFDEEMRQGFFTVPGGHRVGLAGKTVMEGGEIQCLRYISFLNIRLSHQKKGCADVLMPYLFQKGQVCHTLIISPPRCGKTTLLRDVIRQLSDGTGGLPGVTVGVVDERSEIAGEYLGLPQNDLGIRTDVLDGCRKAEGMRMLLRAMAPQVIAVDEIGNERDKEALEEVFYCGCRLLATAHGSSVEDVRRHPLLRGMAEKTMFERYVVLGSGAQTGCIREIQDAEGVLLYRAG